MKHFHTEREKKKRETDIDRERERVKGKKRKKEGKERNERKGNWENDTELCCYLSNHQNQTSHTCQRIRFRY